MKFLFLLGVLVALAFAAPAQLLKQPPMRVAEGTIFRQKVAVAPYAGRRYRFTMRAQVTILSGLSHYAPQEDPAVFNAAVLDFLAKH